MKLSIVVPAYNEERRLGSMLDAYLPFFTSRFADAFELIVVVNGSTDGTAALAERYAGQWPALRVIVEPASIGKGGAVMLGLRAAAGDCAGYVDADGSTPPSAFLDLVERTGGQTPVVIASRWMRGSSVFPPQPLIRRLASRAFNVFTRTLFGLRLHDTQCGAKVFHRRALERLLIRPGIITRWAFDVDLLYRIQCEGLPVLEIPTVWHDVEGSKLVVTETSLEMLAALLRLRLMYSPLRWIPRLYDRFLLGGRTTEEALRRSLLFGIGGQASNVFNFVFQVAAAHLLLRYAGGAADAYGDMAAALGLAALVNAFLGSAADRAGEADDPVNGGDAGARDPGWHVALAVALPVVAIVALAWRAGAIAGVMRMVDVRYVYLALALGVAHVFYTVQAAALKAMRNSRSVALLDVSHSLMRAVAGGALLVAGFGVTGALTGALAAAAGAALLAAGMRRAGGRFAAALGGADWKLIPPMAGFALLSGADILLAKIRFAPVEAGEYALAAMIARMVFFLPMPLAAAAFSRAAGTVARAAWRRELAVILFSVMIPAAVMMLFAGEIAWLMTGAAPGATVSLVRSLTLAYLPLPLIALLLRYNLSRRRFAWVSLILPAGGLAFILAALAPAAVSRGGVASTLAAVNAACLVALLLCSGKAVKWGLRK